ncbi:SLC13 family permease [Desulfovibrio litoralis]|uniref:Anion transporter n=1 Tax=Desulfovibrio litoralis DSM 11393 TaxID=1121455 RepID=A0A1M7RQD5_9BACT|nr:SLC13 family permease [Desulfovibrio litoralis]SHN48577.1 anion transporter [Desulfovibrio litoralis DSM 11393]
MEDICSPAVMTLIVLGIMAILFVTELVPLTITAMGGAITLGLLGIIPASTVFSGLSNSTVVLFAGMFVIGAAMFHTGLAQKVGVFAVKSFGTSEKSLMFGTMLIAAVLSSISSNTGTTAALMPVIIGICSVAKIPASRQLMPLAFAAGFGGTITLVGTPPNIIANGALKGAALAPFGFFEFALIGIPITIVGMLYMMFIGNKLLPKTEGNAEAAAEAGDLTADAKPTSNDPKKMWITGLTLLAVVVVMALDIKRIPLEMAAVAGAIFLVLTGCLKEKEAYRGIDWVTIFLFAGMMPVATALDKSGAGKMIADGVISLMGGNPSPYALTAILFLLSAILTQFMSNTASAALLCPIGISIAKGIGASPHGVIMAIAIAASCAFATPIGTPPNTLVLGAGNYRFMDYVKVGGPLVFIYFILCSILIPIIWPFNIVAPIVAQ